MPTNQEFTGGAKATTLNGAINSAVTSIVLGDGTGYPTGAGGKKFVLSIGTENTASFEKVLCDSRSGNNVTINASGRGYDGTSATSHANGETVNHTWSAVAAQDANDHVNDTTLDSHTQYQKKSLLTTAGDLPYASGASTWARRAIGSTGQTMKVKSGLPTWVNEGPINVQIYGALGDGVGNSTTEVTTGTDDTTAIQAAVDALPAGGGTVYFPPGIYRCDTGLDLGSKRGVVLAGAGSRTNGADATSVLHYTGTGTGRFIDARSTAGLVVEGLEIRHSKSAFTGTLLDLARNASDTTGALVTRCTLTGYVASPTAVGIGMGGCISSTVRNNTVLNLAVGIDGRTGGSYANQIHVTDNLFYQLGTTAIKRAGESWLIAGNTFENLTSGAARAYLHGDTSFAYGFTFIGNWCGDSTAGGTWIDDLITLGGHIAGNRFAGSGASVGVQLANGSQGVNLAGNRFETATGITIDATVYGLMVAGNDFFGATTITGLSNAQDYAVVGNKGINDTIFHTLELVQDLKVDGSLGLFGSTPAAKQTVTGSRGGNAALASLITALATYGLIVDSSS